MAPADEGVHGPDETSAAWSRVMTNNRTKVKNRDRKIDAYIHSDW
jgi:hypothetical protein